MNETARMAPKKVRSAAVACASLGGCGPYFSAPCKSVVALNWGPPSKDMIRPKERATLVSGASPYS